MAKQMKQDTPLVPRKRRLAALIAATRCAGEKRDTLSCHARRCGNGRTVPDSDFHIPLTGCHDNGRIGTSVCKQGSAFIFMHIHPLSALI